MISRVWPLALLALLGLPGCRDRLPVVDPGQSPTVVTERDRPVATKQFLTGVRRIALEDLELAAPLDRTRRGSSHCEDPFDMGSGAVRLSVRWSDDAGRTARVVLTVFDSAGEMVTYNDLRWNPAVTTWKTPSQGQEPLPVQTSIVFTRGRPDALVFNGSGEDRASYAVPLEEALRAPELDNPLGWIDELRTRCGAGVLPGY